VELVKRLDQILAMLILLLAVRAVIIAPREFTLGARPWAVGFWMLSSGLLLAVCGALSLLRIRYGATAPGLRAVAALTATAVGALLLSAGIIADEIVPSTVVAALLLATASMALRAKRAA
jgi:hypothetical protein